MATTRRWRAVGAAFDRVHEVEVETNAKEAHTPPRRDGPEGSTYDAAHPRRRSRTLRRRLRGSLSRFLIGLLTWTLPYLHYAYCWLVWKTSRIESPQSGPCRAVAERHGRGVSLLWHQEVFMAPFTYKELRPHTLASTGDLGRIATRICELCDSQVFRGGSSTGKSRRKRVLEDVIRYMNENEQVFFGVTVDGSKGPAFRMKNGGAAIGHACRAPIFLLRSWYSRCIQLPTWDRTAIPLPFGRIHVWAVGPYWIEPDCSHADLVRAFKHLEAELLDLAEVSFRHFEKHPRRGPREGFPPGWKPRWAPGQLGIPLGPYDLKPDEPPPWAPMAGVTPRTETRRRTIHRADAETPRRQED